MFAKYVKKAVTLFSFISVGYSTQAHAADALKICVDIENPPFMYAKDGKAAGLYPALIAAAFKNLSVSVNIEAKPWKRCLSEMDEGIGGTGGIYKNQERLLKYDYSEQMFVEKMAVFYSSEHPLQFTKVGDLVGKKVGVIRGWSYGDEFDKNVKEGKIQAQEVKSDFQNFEKLIAGRVDAILAIDEAGNVQLKNSRFEKIKKSAEYLFQNPTFLAISKKSKQTDLLAKFSKEIANLTASGALAKVASEELIKGF